MSTKTLKSSPAKGRLAEALRTRGPQIAALASVAFIAGIIGRLTAPVPEIPPPAAAPSARPSPERSLPPPQVFDLEENPKLQAGIPIRPMDRDIFGEVTGGHLERQRMKDVFPDRPYLVRFVGSVAERHIGIVLIDLDRDGKFEERWELKATGVERVVPKDPTADGMPVMYTLSHGRWQPH